MTASDRNQHISLEDLSTYADGEIWDPADRDRIEQHLAVCEFCRQELSELQAVSMLLADLPEPELPRSFRLTDADAGLDSGGGPVPIQPWILRHQMLFRYASLAAVFLLAVVITVDLLPGTSEDADEVSTMMDHPEDAAPDADEQVDDPGIMSVEDDEAPAESEAAGEEEALDEDIIMDEEDTADADRDTAELPVEEEAAEEEAAEEDVPVAESTPEVEDDQQEHPLAVEDSAEDEVGTFAEPAAEPEETETQRLTADDPDEGLTTLRMVAIALAVLSVLFILAGFVLPRWWQSSPR